MTAKYFGMVEKQNEVYYHDYEGLDQLLNCQHRESEKRGKPAHDEMLFIVVHQAYELWFKQIIFELEAVCAIFSKNPLPEREVGRAVGLLSRIGEIQKVLLQHLQVLETMTPLDFLDFRDYLVPASGFQSWQFRIIENRLGLPQEKRTHLGEKFFLQTLRPREQEKVTASLEKPSLFMLVQAWLERVPFLKMKNFDFWSDYRKAAEEMLTRDQQIISENALLPEEIKRMELARLTSTRASFETLFDEKKYAALLDKKARFLSYPAMKAVLLIHLYRDEPILHLPYRLLTTLMDIDENFTAWRYRHMLMVRRMIGEKIGTGGSSGFDYLKQGAEELRIFPDFFSVSTFLIPRSKLPTLPEEVRKALDFSYKT